MQRRQSQISHQIIFTYQTHIVHFTLLALGCTLLLYGFVSTYAASLLCEPTDGQFSNHHDGLRIEEIGSPLEHEDEMSQAICSVQIWSYADYMLFLRPHQETFTVDDSFVPRFQAVTFLHLWANAEVTTVCIHTNKTTQPIFFWEYSTRAQANETINLLLRYKELVLSSSQSYYGSESSNLSFALVETRSGYFYVMILYIIMFLVCFVLVPSSEVLIFDFDRKAIFIDQFNIFGLSVLHCDGSNLQPRDIHDFHEHVMEHRDRFNRIVKRYGIQLRFARIPRFADEIDINLFCGQFYPSYRNIAATLADLNKCHHAILLGKYTPELLYSLSQSEPSSSDELAEIGSSEQSHEEGEETNEEEETEEEEEEEEESVLDSSLNPHGIPTIHSRLRSCIICASTTASVAYLPCGHICTCYSCAYNVSICPVCRTGITYRQPITVS